MAIEIDIINNNAMSKSTKFASRVPKDKPDEANTAKTLNQIQRLAEETGLGRRKQGVDKLLRSFNLRVDGKKGKETVPKEGTWMKKSK
jgi:hypothetical protein